MSLIQDVAGAAVPTRSPALPSSRSRRRGPGACPPVRAFALRETAAALGTLAFVLVFNFFLFRMLPGDPIGMYTRGRNVPPEQLASCGRELDRRSASSS